MKKIKLGDIGSVRMCKRILKEETNSEGGIPFYKISTFGNVADVFIDKDKYENYKTRFSYPKKGEVLISAAGTIGRTVIYNGEDAYFQDSNIVWIENEEKEVLNSFLYYAYQNVRWKTSNGSTILRLYNDDLRNTEILIPEDISEQKRIAKVLSNIDRKISINREINRNLEELAKQIYDYWFVQFDFPNEEGKPYKSSGGKMVWNETLKRKIPADWEVKKLNACLKHINTGLNPRDNFVLGNGTIKYITVKNLTTDGTIDFSGCDLIDENARTIVHERSKISKGDILFASISPLGRCYIIQEQPEKWDINESVFSIRPNQKIITPEYLYCYLTSEWFMKKAEKEATGSIFAGIRMAALNAMTIIVPDEKVLKRFSSLIKPIFGQKDKLFNGIQHLTKLRDELLPLLMNGQVTLNSCLSAD